MDMTTFHHLPGSIVAVEGLPDASMKIVKHGIYDSIYYVNDKINFMTLPDGEWQIIGWSDDEAVARQVVDMHENGTYWNYIGIWGGFTTAKGSLQSLLRSVGCEADRVLLLKKID